MLAATSATFTDALGETEADDAVDAAGVAAAIP